MSNFPGEPMSSIDYDKLRKLANQHPEIAGKVAEIVREGSARKVQSEQGEAPYPHKIDHGYDQPLSGGWDIMKRLQDQLLIEQGRPPREPNPRLARGCGGSCGGSCSCGKALPAAELQARLSRVLRGASSREMVRRAVVKYANDNDTVVLINAAVEDILDQAIAVALSPDHVAAVLNKHTIEED